MALCSVQDIFYNYISISIYKASAMLHLGTSAPCIASIVSTFYSLDEFFTELKSETS